MLNPVYLLSWVGALCAAWFLWTLGIRRLLLDGMRERLFDLRFRLFRLGTTGELPFDSEAYRVLELLICGLLRFGHRITFLTFLFSQIEGERAKKEKNYEDVSKQIALKIARLKPETQEKLGQILKDLHSALIVYMAFSSLFFLSIFIVMNVCKWLGLWHPENARERVTRVIEREAYLAESRRGVCLAAA